MLELLRPLVIVTGLVLFEAVPNILHERWVWPEQPTRIGTGILIVVVIYFLDVVYRRWTSFEFVRRSRYPGPTSLEGLWLQRVELEGRPYSISRIRYVSERRWTYSGVGFDAHFAPKAEWHSASLHYDEEEKKWYFAGDAWLLDHNPGIGTYKRTARGYVRPMLENTSETLLASSLDGSVVDVDLGGNNAVFTVALHRCDDLYPVRLPSVEHIKRMPANEVEYLFVKKNLKIPSPGSASVASSATAGTPEQH
jgi:hypothetical protein